MEQFELRAYETLGYWSITLIRVWVPEDGHVTRSLVYRGDHVPIDEEDPTLRATLLLHQVHSDLDWALAHDGELSLPEDIPLGH